MVEIAIALGVIGFALVAIIGILPSGLQVQRDNRSETIINQDGTFWLEAIRNGAMGIHDLTQYVEKVVVITRDPNVLPPNNVILSNVFSFNGANGFLPYYTASDVIGLLTTQAAITNMEASAYVWAFSGSAAEKDPDTDKRELTFKYLMDVHIERATNFALPFSNLATNPPLGTPPLAMTPLDSLYHLRLTLAYPLIRDDKPAPRRQSYRALISRDYISNNVGGISFIHFIQ
jgi:hypothetical protein